MKDQVDALVQVGVAATYINSSLSFNEANERIREAKQGMYKLLYIAPERLESREFIEDLKQMEIPLVAVDEAHCISQWGHDFRPSYRHIQQMVHNLPQNPTVLALTATATPKVREDICDSLELMKKIQLLLALNEKIYRFLLLKDRTGCDF